MTVGGELRPIGNIKTTDVKVRSRSHYQTSYKDDKEMQFDKDINKRCKDRKRRDLKLSYNLPFSCSTEHKDAYLGRSLDRSNKAKTKDVS